MEQRLGEFGIAPDAETITLSLARMSVFGSVTARTPSMTTLTILFLLLTAKVVAAVTVTAAK